MALGWGGILRLGLVQTGLGAITVLSTSTLNRVMTVELHLPAIVPGMLVGLHYAVQVLRPRLGYGADQGGRRTPWIVGGMALLGAGALGAALAVAAVAGGWGLVLPGLAALAAFLAIGVGVGAAGTAVLTLLADRVAPRLRAQAATAVWIMMIAGIVATAGAGSALLAPFSAGRLVAVVGGVALLAVGVTVLALWGVEPTGAAPAAPARTPFGTALREVWREPPARRFAVFVFVSMLAYSGQELVIEPFAGLVFGMPPAATAGLTGLHHAGVLAGMALVGLGGWLAGGFAGGAARRWVGAGCAASAALAAVLAGCGAAGAGVALRPVLFALGVANGVFAVAAIGAMMGLAGEGRAGRSGTRMGLWGASQALAFGAGGVLATGASDVARALLGSPGAAYAAVFGMEAVLFAVACGLAGRALPRAARPVAAGLAGEIA